MLPAVGLSGGGQGGGPGHARSAASPSQTGRDRPVSKQRARVGKSARTSAGQAATPERGGPPTWRYRAGRLLQMVGMFVLPFGIAAELMGRGGLGQSLV